MTGFSLHRRAASVGLAIGADRVVAASADAGSVYRLPAKDERQRPSLTEALVRLREVLGVDRAVVSVALLPPLAQVRGLELPRLRAAERRRVLARDAARYFFDAREPQVVDAQGVGGSRGSPEPVVAVAAPAQVVEEVHAAARAVGWSLDVVVPAVGAWIAGALRVWPILARSGAAIVVIGDARVEVLFARDGELESMRRFPRRADWIALAADAITRSDDEPRVAILGSTDDDRAALERVLTERGASVVPAPGPLASLCEDSAAFAAAFADEATGLALVPESIRAEHAGRERRLSRTLAAVAAAGVVAAAALELLGAQRELAAIEAQRAAIRGRVARVMEVRDTIGALDARLAALATRELSLPQWSAVIADLARHLPADAHVVGLRGHGDSLALEGAAARAAGVFEALQAAPGVTGVRAESPIRREMQSDGQTSVERFTLTARVTAPATRGPTQRQGGRP